MNCMNYDFSKTEELIQVKPKKFRLTDDNKDLIQKRLTRLALAGEFYESKCL